MKRILSMLIAVMLFGSLSAQTYLFQESFNNGIPSTWTMFNDNNTVASNISSYFPNAWVSGTNVVGVNCAVATSYFNPAATADRWLVTPKIGITEAHTYLYFMTASVNGQYPEKLLIKASTGGAVKDSFTTTLLTLNAIPGGTWSEYYVNLDQFIGDSVNLAFQLNTNDGVAVMVDEVAVYIPLQTQVSLVSVSTPSSNPVNSDMNVNITVKNTGYDALTAFDATYAANGTGSPVMNVSNVNMAMGETYTFNHSTPFNTATAGDYTFTASITNPNGQSVTMGNPNDASSTTNLYDGTLATMRRTLLEEFSTAKCPNCPPAVTRISNAITGVEGMGNVIWIVHHAGYYTDGITCPASEAATFFYNDGGSTYAPAMMLNRKQYDASEPGPVFGVGATADITTAVNTAKSDPCFTNVAFQDVAYNAASRAVTGTVAGNFTRPTANPAKPVITVYVVEDSIVMAQSGASDTYVHMHAVRDCITASMGDALTVNADNTFSYSINYTLPATFEPAHCRLVALVSNYNSADANDCVVLNAATTNNSFAPHVGINEVSNIEMRMFPNPANERVNIITEENIRSIRVVNTLGQVVYSNSNVNGEAFSLSTNEYAAGMYIISVSTDKGISTQRISVRH